MECGTKTETGISLHLSMENAGSEISYADIFVFNDDALQRLDSYQRVEIRDGEIPFAASQKGKKLIAAIINPHADRYKWAHINSYQALMSEKADLRDEVPENLLMSGVCHAAAGADMSCEIDMRPVSAEIRLSTIRCDFSSKPYNGARLENAKVYLTNVSTEARIMQQTGFMPESICNMAGLKENEMKDFGRPDILMREIGQPVGTGSISTGISLLCYPNECEEESPGSPFTRLVVEGTVNGQTCYYPININRRLPEENAWKYTGTNTGSEGIERGCRYIFDLTIKSTGSSDPDTAVTPDDIDINCDIIPWSEMEDMEIIF